MEPSAEVLLLEALWSRRSARRRINVALLGSILVTTLGCALVAQRVTASAMGNSWASEFYIVFGGLIFMNAMAWVPAGVMLALIANADSLIFRLVPTALAGVIPVGMWLLLTAVKMPFDEDFVVMAPTFAAWFVLLVAMGLPDLPQHVRAKRELEALEAQLAADAEPE